MKAFPLVFVLLAAAAGCGKAGQPGASADHDADKSKPSAALSLTPEAQRAAGIETATARRRKMQETLSVPGVVNPTSRGQALITPPVAGRVIEIPIQLGEQVRQGQTLAVIESPDLAQSWAAIAEAKRSRDAASAGLSEAKSEDKLAAARLEAAKDHLKNQTEMAQAGGFSQAPLQTAQAQVIDSQAEATASSQDLAYKTAQLQRAQRLFRDGLLSRSELEAAQNVTQDAKVAVAKAQSRLDIAKQSLQRERTVFRKGLLNTRELQTAAAEKRAADLDRQDADIRVVSAQAALANAKRAVADAEAAYRTLGGGTAAAGGRMNLVAPISGVVARLDVTNGQAVSRAQALMQILDLRSVWISANISESDADQVHVGQGCTVTFTSLPDHSFDGAVQAVGSILDPKTRTLDVECLVRNTGLLLMPQMYANVNLRIGRSISVVAVPQSAVIQDGGVPFVYVKDGSSFEKTQVSTGVSEGEFTEIRDGSQPGQQIAAKGTFVLQSEAEKDKLQGDKD